MKTYSLQAFCSLLIAIAFPSCNMVDKKVLARSTNYHHREKIGKNFSGDIDTRNFRTATGVSLRYFPINSSVVGAVAVDPNVIPYGSIIIAPSGKKFIAIDTGHAVISRKAALEMAKALGLPAGSPEYFAPVLDFYSFYQVGKLWDKFQIIPYEGKTPFMDLPIEDKLSYIQQITTKELLAKT